VVSLGIRGLAKSPPVSVVRVPLVGMGLVPAESACLVVALMLDERIVTAELPVVSTPAWFHIEIDWVGTGTAACGVVQAGQDRVEVHGFSAMLLLPEPATQRTAVVADTKEQRTRTAQCEAVRVAATHRHRPTHGNARAADHRAVPEKRQPAATAERHRAAVELEIAAVRDDDQHLR
jgi:hypothetical protein